jgi:hypothetical protein
MKKYIIIIICISFLSCTKYLDGAAYYNQTFINNSYKFSILREKNLFEYINDIDLVADKEVLKPTKFKLDLPKDLIYFEMPNMSSFFFYYRDSQCIYINIDNYLKNDLINDTLYIPSKSEIEQLIDKSPNGKFKCNLRANEYVVDRDFYRLNRGKITILLYNIKHRNFDMYLKSIQSLILTP